MFTDPQYDYRDSDCPADDRDAVFGIEIETDAEIECGWAVCGEVRATLWRGARGGFLEWKVAGEFATAQDVFAHLCERYDDEIETCDGVQALMCRIEKAARKAHCEMTSRYANAYGVVA